MMLKALRAALIVGGLTYATLAVSQPGQQAPDPAFLQAAVNALQAQRNAALDGQAATEARAALLNDQIARLQARVAELEKAGDKAKRKDELQ